MNSPVFNEVSRDQMEPKHRKRSSGDFSGINRQQSDDYKVKPVRRVVSTKFTSLANSPSKQSKVSSKLSKMGFPSDLDAQDKISEVNLTAYFIIKKYSLFANKKINNLDCYL